MTKIDLILFNLKIKTPQRILVASTNVPLVEILCCPSLPIHQAGEMFDPRTKL